VSARYRQLAAHVRRQADDDLNDLLVELPPTALRPWGRAAGPMAGRAGRAGEPAPARAGRSLSAACAGWRRRADAVGALAWVTPASGVRRLVLAFPTEESAA
jgi:hypothetical protein